MITIPVLATFLSIEPNEIKEISVIDQDNEQIIVIVPRPKKCSCPNEGCECDKYQFKEYKERKIKHALFLNKSTTFIYKVRRNKCLGCGKTFSEPNSFAPKRSRVSYETVKIVLDTARNYNSTWKEIASKAHISDTTAINIFDRYVNNSRRNLPRIMCIDECYNKNQFDKPYSAILFDFLDSKIIDVIEDRSKNRLASYFNKIKKEERNNVEYIIIDMWDSYLDLAKTFFPKAIVAVDSFHVMREIGTALDKVRKRIMKRYKSGSKEYYLLKKWNRVLFNEQKPYKERIRINGYDNRYLNQYDIQQLIIGLDDDLKIAQDFYIHYKFMNSNTPYEKASEAIDKYINYKNITDVEEFIPVIKMLQNWKEWIVNSFIIVEERRLSNGPIEGFNSNFKKLMTVSNGLFSFNRFRNRLIYCYNKLNCLKPVSKKIDKKKRKKRGKYNKKPHNLS